MCPYCRSLQDNNASVCGVCGEEMRVDDTALIALAGPLDPAPTWCLPQTAPVNAHKILIADVVGDPHLRPDGETLRVGACDRWEDDPTVQLAMDAPSGIAPKRRAVVGEARAEGEGGAVRNSVGRDRSIRYAHTRVSKEAFVRDSKLQEKLIDDDVAISRAALTAINKAARKANRERERAANQKRGSVDSQVDVTAQLGVAWEGLASNINGTLEAPDAIFGKLWGAGS